MILKSFEPAMINRYTVKKKNIDRMEKILGHKIYDRHIRLYSTKWGLFPNGAKNRMKWWTYSPMQRFSIGMKEWVELRDYQQQAIEHVKINAWGLIEAATGSGKSLMCIWITTTYRSKTLIVCPTKKLVKEMVDKFVQFTWYEPWTYYSDWKNIKDVTITTTASFVSDMTWDKKELQWARFRISKKQENTSDMILSRRAREWR